jgi:hypothetical protein
MAAELLIAAELLLSNENHQRRMMPVRELVSELTWTDGAETPVRF